MKVILSVGFNHGSIPVYSHVACKVLTHAHPVATTEAVNEICKLLSRTQLTRRRDYLPVKPSQEIIWASIVLLSALSAKTLYCKKTAQGYLLRY